MRDDLVCLSAARAVALLHAGEVKPSELVEAAIARIEATDGVLNALPERCFERAREQAAQLERSVAQGGPRPLLGGLPIVVKDNNDVGGVRTTGGTPIFRDRVAERSDRTIAWLERNGAIPLAKANLSELGGANTTNRVFGATRHPWNPALTCGGSSGGSAVAVATGQVWLAHGNDVGGSLRIPTAFCGVLGLRPTPGRVVRKELCDPFDTVMVDGPIARSVEDLALMFDAMVGLDTRDPLSAASPDAPFLPAARSPQKPGRSVAWCAAPGGLPVDERIVACCEAAIERLAAQGLRVARDEPGTEGAVEAITALRADGYAQTWEPLFPQHGREAFTEDVWGDIERGRAQNPATVRAAQRWRAGLSRRMTAFFERHGFLLCPATQAMPFPVEQPWPREIAGRRLEKYFEWIAIDYVWSLTGCPSMALPAGTADGLPVGLQIVGPPRSEAAMLQLAAWMEREIGWGPMDPVSPLKLQARP